MEGVVTTSADGLAAIGDTSSLEQIGQVSHSAVVMDATFTKEGRHLLSVTAQGEVRMTTLYKDLDELIAHSEAVSVRDLGAVENAQIFSLVPKDAE